MIYVRVLGWAGRSWRLRASPNPHLSPTLCIFHAHKCCFFKEKSSECGMAQLIYLLTASHASLKHHLRSVHSPSVSSLTHSWSLTFSPTFVGVRINIREYQIPKFFPVRQILQRFIVKFSWCSISYKGSNYHQQCVLFISFFHTVCILNYPGRAINLEWIQAVSRAAAAGLFPPQSFCVHCVPSVPPQPL